MSDSDDDLLQKNVFTYANDNTTIYAKGPNVNNTNMTGLSFRNNVMTSTMRMPVNFERQRYAESHYDQRSMYYRREMSPMSLRAASEFGSRNYNHSIHKNGIGCQSMYGGRGRSPFSVCSIDSTATLSANDIAFAIKNTKFDCHDIRVIKEAYKHLIKPHKRKMIEKRRNLRLLLKRSCRKSGEDSGEQGSDSSMCSDDNRSIKTTICNENIPKTHFGTNITDKQIVRDCTENIKQNTLQNMFRNNSSIYSTKDIIRNTSIMTEGQSPSSTKAQNMSIMTQKERFKRGFILPSQRFSKAVNATIHENEKVKAINYTRKNNVNSCSNITGKITESDSDSEEIFRGFSEDTNQVTSSNRKRALDTEDFNSNRKRSRLDSPKQKIANIEPLETTCNTSGPSNDFIFAKPKMPIKKINTKKDFPHEKLLAKSRVPEIQKENISQSAQSNKLIENNNNDTNSTRNTDVQHCSNDVSMRPSFIKRKLFTQKLDVTENKNVCCDSVSSNSLNVYTEAIRERNKGRKLVTSQSCLSRDVASEDSNVLDLIHKIVPPEQINTTKIAHKTDLCTNKPDNVDNDDKWDVTSAILNCNNQDVSDTYTDEEIFNITFNKESVNKDKSKKVTEKPKLISECKIVVEKLKPSVARVLESNNSYQLPQSKLTNKEASKKSVKDFVNSFWDTDLESDIEFKSASSLKTTTQKFQGAIHQKKLNQCADPKLNKSTKKGPITRGTILNVRNHTFQNKMIAEFDKPNLIEKANIEVTKVGDRNKLTNKKPNSNEKKVTEKENVPVIHKKTDSGRKPKVKKCIECNNDQNQLNTTTKTSKRDKFKKNNENEKQPSEKPNNKSVCTPEPKQRSKKGANNKISKCVTNEKVQSQNNNLNVRIQPKRKSKEKSFNQSLKQGNKVINTQASIVSENRTKTKLTKDSDLKNCSFNSINTRITRSSREKLNFDSSGCDQNSTKISNISNRSLRLYQRNLREYKIYPIT